MSRRDETPASVQYTCRPNSGTPSTGRADYPAASETIPHSAHHGMAFQQFFWPLFADIESSRRRLTALPSPATDGFVVLTRKVGDFADMGVDVRWAA